MSDVQAKTYAGGATLPALTAEYQPVQVGRNEDNELVPEQRAFVATVRNRSNADMFVKEGNGDGIRIDPGESYVVMRTDGTSQVHLKGTNVGTDYEIRTVEAHNDFSLTDKIEGFAQSVSALLQSSRRQGRTISEPSRNAVSEQTSASKTGSVSLGANESTTITMSDTLPLLQYAGVGLSQITYEFDFTPTSGDGYGAETEIFVLVGGTVVHDSGVIGHGFTSSNVAQSGSEVFRKDDGVVYVADTDIAIDTELTLSDEDGNGVDVDYEITTTYQINARGIDNA